jgi:hypothetical protein
MQFCCGNNKAVNADAFKQRGSNPSADVKKASTSTRLPEKGPIANATPEELKEADKVVPAVPHTDNIVYVRNIVKSNVPPNTMGLVYIEDVPDDEDPNYFDLVED